MLCGVWTKMPGEVLELVLLKDGIQDIQRTMYDFGEHDYFDQGANWLDVFKITNFDITSSIDILELGSATGSSACWISDNLLSHNDSTLTCVDDCPIAEEKMLLLNNIAQSTNSRKISVKHQRLEKFIMNNTAKYDLIYVDAWHFFVPVLFQGYYAEANLRPNGIVIFDDTHTEGVTSALELLEKNWSLTKISLNADNQIGYQNVL